MKQDDGSNKTREYNEYSPRLVEAERCYREALHIRSQTLGDPHPDTIVSMHNLAELLLVLGKQQEATELQEKIIQLVEHPNTATSSSSSSSSSSTKIPEAPHNNNTIPPPMVSVTKSSTHSSSQTGPATTASGLGSGSGKGVSHESTTAVITSSDTNPPQPTSTEREHTHTRRKIEKNVMPPQVTYATRPKKKQ